MSATEGRRQREPVRPDQPIVSAALDREKLDFLRDVARLTDRSVSDLVRRAVDAYRPQLLSDLVERALLLSREEVNDNNDQEEGARDGP